MHDDLTLAELADYLQLDLAGVTRMAERGKIPGRRVQGEWRFSRPELHHWLEQRIHSSDDEELMRLEPLSIGKPGGTTTSKSRSAR